jgi:choline dehydrogenase/5-(hydroxymethyl)furfural/furfural oxidase
MMFDAVVVGGGTSGCVVAARLSEDPNRRVLLLEAGPDVPADAAVAGPFALSALGALDRQWTGLVAHRAAGEPTSRYLRGRGIGGTSTINGMVAEVGRPYDYDGWAARGATGWAWADVAPVFASLPVPTVTVPAADWAPLSRAVAVAASGLAPAQPVALAWTGRRRASSDVASLEPARARPNLAVRGGSLVDRVLLTDRRARGVRLADGEEIEADVVVLCAGAIHSPAILLRSGVDRPGVGRHLVDHPSADLALAVRPEARLRRAADRFSFDCRIRWSSGAADDDLELLPIPALGESGDALAHGAVTVALLRPHSTGRITLVAADPEVEPRVDVATLHDERDVTALRRGVRQALEVVHHPAVMEIAEPPAVPATDASDEDLDRWLRAHPGGYYHAAGTCRMGGVDDPDAVVDPRCRVIDHAGLWVADASVMPRLPRAAPMLTCLMIGERVAAFVRDEAQHTPSGRERRGSGR